MSQALRARLAAKLAAKRTEPSNAIALPPYESDRLLADAYDALDAYKNARALRCLGWCAEDASAVSVGPGVAIARVGAG
jgi:hypothetical protein